jgi:hypothetical protein
MAKKNWLGDRLDRNGWPVKVPVLGPGDFCTEQYNKGRKCCLVGWSLAVTGPAPDPEVSCPLSKNFRIAIEHEIGRPDVVGFNDYRSKPADRARVWNRAMRRLGYNVPASACK